MTRRTGDRGAVGGIEVLPFGFLTFVAATLLIANVWGVIDARFAVAAAARDASRAYVEAPDEAGAAAASRASATETLAAFGRADDRAVIGEPTLTAAFGRCARVTITVSYRVPAITIPFLAGWGNLEPVTARATALVDPFRSGLPGAASCS